MELMPMGTLKNAIESRKFSQNSWADRYQILLDITEGGAFLHSSKTPLGSPKRVVLHQDLKSANVLLCMEDGQIRAKLADFGLACKL